MDFRMGNTNHSFRFHRIDTRDPGELCLCLQSTCSRQEQKCRQGMAGHEFVAKAEREKVKTHDSQHGTVLYMPTNEAVAVNQYNGAQRSTKRHADALP